MNVKNLIRQNLRKEFEILQECGRGLLDELGKIANWMVELAIQEKEEKENQKGKGNGKDSED